MPSSLGGSKLEMIAFDADDTLWHSERYYRQAESRFLEILSPYVSSPRAALDVLHAIEIRNLTDFGYGIKGFLISMLEAAIEASGSAVPASAVGVIIEVGREMTRHEIHLLHQARETVERLAASHRLMLITKGDLMDQERKIVGSGLGPFFEWIEIVSDKTPATYQSILQKRGIDPRAFLMVGNSLRSDVLPVIALGGWGVYVPYELNWAHEHIEEPPAHPDRFFELPTLADLPDLVSRIEANSTRV